MSHAKNVACAVSLRLIQRHAMKVHAFLISTHDGGQDHLTAMRKAAPGNWTSGLEYTVGLLDAGALKKRALSLMIC
jgi:hypothetical protein